MPGLYSGSSPGADSASYMTDPVTGQRIPAKQYYENLRRYQNLAGGNSDSDGGPLMPKYDSYLKGNGTLADRFKVQKGEEVYVDKRAQDAVRENALRTGPSAWASLAEKKQQAEQMQAMDNSRQAMSGQQFQQMNNLAMNGGIQSGSRERLAKNSMRESMMANQGIARQGQMDRMNIGLQDETNRRQDLTQTVDSDYKNAGIMKDNRTFGAQVDQFNIQNNMSQIDAKRNFDLKVYEEQMKKYGAAKSADATKNASVGKK